MRIDSHQHFWQLARGDYGWMTPEQTALYRNFWPEDLAPLLQRYGITGTVLVQAAETVAETEFMLGLAEQHSFIQAVVGWVDFASPQAVAEIERLSRHPKLVGLRPMIQDIPDVNWMLKPELEPAFAAMQACGLRFDALLKPIHLSVFTKFLQRYPTLPIVIDHGAKPQIRQRPFSQAFDGWAAHMQTISQEARVHCKLSGLITEAAADWQAEDIFPYMDHLYDCFGPDRLLWGSDWPVSLLAGGYDPWWSCTQQWAEKLNDEQREKLLGYNAMQFYGLTP